MNDENRRPQVVIAGAGFGGLNAARALRKVAVDVTLVDQNNFHTFQPLLYQVATAGLEPEEIAHAVRGIFQEQRNVSFRLGKVVGVDLASCRLRFESGSDLRYDYAVLATGASTDYFGVPGADEHCFALKSLRDAVTLRGHIIRQFERTDQQPDLVEEGSLTFVVVGGGPTGVETAGALAELFQKVLRKDYPRLPFERVRVVAVEAQPVLFGTFHPRSQDYAEATLRRRGVEVKTGCQVLRVNRDGVEFSGGLTLRAHTVIWAAGIRSNSLADTLSVERTRNGGIVVGRDLTIPGYPRVCVIGDLAACVDGDGKPHPQLAPVAIQQGRYVADAIRKKLKGEEVKPFVYKDKGIMATVGRNSAVAELAGGIRARGFMAWVMWLFLHLVMLIGFRNRLNVLINWTWNYFTYDRSARIIVDEETPGDAV